MRERELKQETAFTFPRLGESLPMRERELKQAAFGGGDVERLSLPMRERELKLQRGETVLKGLGRSPCGSVN